MTGRVIALATLAASGLYLTLALRMPLGTAARPGAAFYPVAVDAFACVVALVNTALAFLRPASAGVADAPGSTAMERQQVGLAVVTLAGFCLLMHPARAGCRGALRAAAARRVAPPCEVGGPPLTCG